MPAAKPKVIVIVGPTASGKSALAVRLARLLGGEVISADSRQVYRELDIGSGKITKAEMRGVPHHMLDVASPARTFTVAQYQKKAAAALRGILRRGKVPIVVGGTGFYIDALLYDYALPAAKPNPRLRRALEKETADALFKQLKALDPRRAATIDRHNKRRLVRAIEIIHATGARVPAMPEKKSIYDAIVIGIAPPASTLKASIKRRLAARLRHGMLNEVARLHKMGLSWKRLDDLGLEYRYASHHLRGLISKEEMERAIEAESWRYAKRQMTWFKKKQKCCVGQKRKRSDRGLPRALHEKKPRIAWRYPRGSLLGKWC